VPDGRLRNLRRRRRRSCVELSRGQYHLRSISSDRGTIWGKLTLTGIFVVRFRPCSVVAMLQAIAICTWIGCLVLESLDQLVEGNCENGAEQRSNPVDPVISVESAEDNVRTKGASWIERATSEEDT
jgi:hypothetical protein